MTEPEPSPVPATYPFPPGTPDKVPADFEAAAVDRLSAQLTAEEVAEFRALRAEKKANDERVAREAEEAAAKLMPPTHHVHLASGGIVGGSTIETHWVMENGDLIPVIGAWPLPEYVTQLA